MSLSTRYRKIYTVKFTSVPRIHSQKQVKPTNMSDCFDTKTTTCRYNGALKGYIIFIVNNDCCLTLFNFIWFLRNI